MDQISPVSYTHLDVYKRQVVVLAGGGNQLFRVNGFLHLGQLLVILFHPGNNPGQQHPAVADGGVEIVQRGACLLYTSRCV